MLRVSGAGPLLSSEFDLNQAPHFSSMLEATP